MKYSLIIALMMWQLSVEDIFFQLDWKVPFCAM